MQKKSLIMILLAAGLGLYVAPIAAQQQSGEWTFRLTPYFVGAAMDGNMTIDERTAELDVSFDKILENLDFGVMLHFQAAKGPWLISLDGIYMGLESTTDQPPGEVSFDQVLVDLTGAYQVAAWVYVLAGLRYNMLSSEIEFEILQQREKSGDVDWFDPIIGGRLAVPLGGKWTLHSRADIGGFGLGSNLTWQLAAYIDFRASNLIAIVGGYRFISNDYETGSGEESFHYDMNIFGPALGVSFIF